MNYDLMSLRVRKKNCTIQIQKIEFDKVESWGVMLGSTSILSSVRIQSLIFWEVKCHKKMEICLSHCTQQLQYVIPQA